MRVCGLGLARSTPLTSTAPAAISPRLRNLMIPLGLSHYETDAHHLGKEGCRDHLDRNGRLYVGGRVVRALSPEGAFPPPGGRAGARLRVDASTGRRDSACRVGSVGSPYFLLDFGNFGQRGRFLFQLKQEEETSMKYALVIATVAALATPALAEDVGVRVGPVGAGVTVGDGHRDYDRDRDRDRDRDSTTVIKEREPADRTTVIKKDNDDGVRSKTIIKDRD
jgi:hypothetical protein